MMERVMSRMSIEVKPDELAYYRGIKRSDETQIVPFEVDFLDSKKVVLKVVSPFGEAAQIILTALGPDQMNFKSSQTDDFDYYIWQRAQ